jgi:trans-aconitate methyltransferase
VITADFETWTPPAEPFDLVVIATAFHWLDERTRLERCARVLRPGGVLAVIETHHIGGGTTEFFAEVQTSCYERFDPTVEPGLIMPAAADIPGGLRYEWEQTYSTAAYLDLLRTYSSTLDLDPADAAALLDCIGSTIDRNYGGHITKRYLTRLLLSRP